MITFTNPKKLTFFIFTLLITLINIQIQGMAQALSPQLESKIKHINIKDKKHLNNKGSMKPAFLNKVLRKTYKGHKALGPIFTNDKNQIITLSKELEGASWGTTQLFLIKSPKKSFIIKGMKDSLEEVNNLIQATKVYGLNRYFYPYNTNRSPQFLFPIDYLSYDDQIGNRHYVSVMPKASGFSLSSLIDIFAEQPGDRKTIQSIAQAYFNTGISLSKFYLETQGKITHGDLHHGNIFYKPKTQQVTLIDNERVASSSKNANIGTDLAFLLMKSLFVVKWNSPNVIKKVRFNDWYSLYIPSFIAGYLSILPQQNRRMLYEWLVNYLTYYVNDETGKNWYSDESILGFSHKQYMEPIFNSVKGSKIFLNIDPISVNKRDKDQKALLHHAALNGDWLTIWPIISAGAQVDARDSEQNTPLHEASYNNHVETIKALVKAGAALHAKNSKGKTPFAKAKANNSKEALTVLHHYGAKY